MFYFPAELLCATGAPILSCVSKDVPGIFMDCHMMVAHPEKVRVYALCSDTVWLN